MHLVLSIHPEARKASPDQKAGAFLKLFQGYDLPLWPLPSISTGISGHEPAGFFNLEEYAGQALHPSIRLTNQK